MNINKDAAKQVTGRKLDWNEIRKKVELTGEILLKNTVFSKEEQRSILKNRAQTIAVDTQNKTDADESIELIEFSLSAERYGIETSFVREVYPLKDFTTLPGTPSFLLGIINVRGKIVSVINLKKFFNLPEKGLGELNKVIIIANEKMEFGILADVILGTNSIPLHTVKASPAAIDGIGSEYLKGVTGEHLIILNTRNILNDEKIIINQKSSSFIS